MSPTLHARLAAFLERRRRGRRLEAQLEEANRRVAALLEHLAELEAGVDALVASLPPADRAAALRVRWSVAPPPPGRRTYWLRGVLELADGASLELPPDAAERLGIKAWPYDGAP